MKKFAIVLAVLLALSGVGYAGSFTNAIGQVWTTYGSEGAYATLVPSLTTNVLTVRAGIMVFYDTNATPDTTSATYTNTATIGDMLVGLVSNKVWMLTSPNTFTALN